MIATKKRILRWVLVMEVLVAAIFFVFGKKGFIALHKQQQEQAVLQSSITQARQEVADLQQQISQWQTNDFYKEQFAREQLLMARPEEEIYVLD